MAKIKISIAAALIFAVTLLHVLTAKNFIYHHIVYRELYFVPLVLVAFWFGVKGGVIASFFIVALYSPVVVMNWDGFSPSDLDKLMEIALFIAVTVLLGILRDRRVRSEARHREHIAALAGSVAHEMNSPLFAAMATAELLKDDVSEESQVKDVDSILSNLRILKELIRKISGIQNITLRDYTKDVKIVDL